MQRRVKLHGPIGWDLRLWWADTRARRLIGPVSARALIAPRRGFEPLISWLRTKRIRPTLLTRHDLLARDPHLCWPSSGLATVGVPPVAPRLPRRGWVSQNCDQAPPLDSNQPHLGACQLSRVLLRKVHESNVHRAFALASLAGRVLHQLPTFRGWCCYGGLREATHCRAGLRGLGTTSCDV